MENVQYSDYLQLVSACKPHEIMQNGSELIDSIMTRIGRFETGGIIFPSLFNYDVLRGIIKSCLPANLDGGSRFMLEEMIENAAEHGNKYDRNKKVTFLWHKCGIKLEFYIVDEGESELNLMAEQQRRIKQAFACEEICGTFLLYSYSKYHEYFSIVQGGIKKGTLLKIEKGIPHETEVSAASICDFPGHRFRVSYKG
jgi:hypothetical protein